MCKAFTMHRLARGLEMTDTYAVTCLNTAYRELSALPTADRRRVMAALGPLTSDPRPRGTQALKGELKGQRGLRVGHHRVVYEVDDERREVRVCEIAHRRDAYSKAGRRRRGH